MISSHTENIKRLETIKNSSANGAHLLLLARCIAAGFSPTKKNKEKIKNYLQCTLKDLISILY